MDEDKDLTDSEWTRLQRIEADRRAWVWKMVTRIGLWIVALAAGVREVIEALKTAGWWPQS